MEPTGLDELMPLRKRISLVLRPFLHEVSEKLELFVLIERPFPQPISEIYLEAKASKWHFFYRRTIHRYEKMLGSIEKHNDNIRSLLDRLKDVSAESLYENPNDISDEQINQYFTLTEEVRAFRFENGDPLEREIARIRVFCRYTNDIRKEWEDWHRLKQLQDEINEADYIDLNQAEALLLKQTTIWAEKKLKGPSVYYSLEDIPDVKDQIKTHNKDYLERLSNDSLFDDINGVSLDAQQRKAAVSPEKNSLVIAGAGSGKTTTICGRVKYLLQRKNAKPESILLLSYSKKSADDLAAKMASISPLLKVGTFHKLGLDILKEATGEQFVVEEQWDAIIEEYFSKEILKSPEKAKDILLYFSIYLHNTAPDKKYRNKGELYEELKQGDFTTLKERLVGLSSDNVNLKTIKKEHVKSIEELAIANFYFLNGIDYEYERPYEVDVKTPERRQYCPDFYLPEYDIYHEHFGLNKNGRAPQFGEAEENDYVRSTTWKLLCHKANGTRLIPTYSWMFQEGDVFEQLENYLKSLGVKFRPLNESEVNSALQSIYLGQTFKSFINFVKSFLALYKARHEDDSVFEEFKRREYASRFEKERAQRFLDICKDVYRYYMNRIRTQKKIDFDDMILQSTKRLPTLDGFRYAYIIVDEFQDISYSRTAFLQALIQHGQSSLFAVGDDWQSIYGFSGCDVGILLDFETYFGQYASYFIGNVHRNSQQLQDIAKWFIEQNPYQIRKEIHASKFLSNPVKVVYYQEEPYEALAIALARIAKINPEAKVLLLGRNNNDISPYLNTSFFFNIGEKTLISKRFPKMQISFSTVHGSKGLEEDFVVLLSASDSANGFPNKTEDDPLLNLVRASADNYPFAEERRLWYVALTRTRNYVYILAPVDRPSKFLADMGGAFEEINPSSGRSYQSDIIFCPDCKSGHLIFRNKDGHSFYGCSNYPYCKYRIDDVKAVKSNKRCPKCGDFMVFIRGQYGPFYGCHRYPKCGYKEKYVPEDE